MEKENEGKNETKKEDQILQNDKQKEEMNNEQNENNNINNEDKKDNKIDIEEKKNTDCIEENNDDEEEENDILAVRRVPTNIALKKLQKIASKTYLLKRPLRWWIFTMFIILNTLMNYDHGTIPAATEQLRSIPGFSDSKIGLFGSFVFVGVIIGSLVSLSIINRFNRKYILILFLALCGFALFVFTLTQKYTILCSVRVVIGVFQAFISIYLPLWCEQYGIEKKKTLMMALVQIGAPLGVVVGYSITALLNMHLTKFPGFGEIDKNKRWIFSFYIQSILIWVLSALLFIFPNKFFTQKGRKVPKLIKNKMLDLYMDDQITFPNLLNIITKETENVKDRTISFFYEGFEIDKYKTSKDLETKSFAVNKEKEIIKNTVSFFKEMKIIFKEPLYILNVLTLSILYFVVSVVQYWASDYMLCALHIKEEHLRLYCFAGVCLTAPTLGVVCGGFIIDKLGGYTTKRSTLVCSIILFFGGIVSIFVPLVNSLALYTATLWLLLFFGANIIPPVFGIVIACLPKEVQGSGNSLTIFFCNLIGYLPAPFAFGALKDKFNKQSEPEYGSRVANKFCMWASLLAFICLVITTILRYKYSDKYDKLMSETKKTEDEKKKQKEKEENEENDQIEKTKENRIRKISKDFTKNLVGGLSTVKKMFAGATSIPEVKPDKDPNFGDNFDEYGIISESERSTKFIKKEENKNETEIKENYVQVDNDYFKKEDKEEGKNDENYNDNKDEEQKLDEKDERLL